MLAELGRRGWTEGESLPCAEARAGIFYEVANEEASAEIFAMGAGRYLASHLPLPDHAACREISQPNFIEEI